MQGRRAAAGGAALALALAAPAGAAPFDHDGRRYDATLEVVPVDGPHDLPGRGTVRLHLAAALARLSRPGLGADGGAEAEAALRAFCGAGPGLLPEGGPLIPHPQLWFEAGAWNAIGLCANPEARP